MFRRLSSTVLISASLLLAVGGAAEAAVPASAGQAGGQNYFQCQIKRDDYARRGYTVDPCVYYPSTGNWLFFYSNLHAE